ncbi:hypothetical protein [Nitrincola nitratireducens]|uniref:Uncharacterized protein n=1 Tax=Nitrincola nitratireducens TaxID=1229521 RepID=W9UYR4_9GAMM|nr:hypothetical protein [Nitrincola nitratireducens]EXJ12234.1 hypothetical protein D791_01123 [Nitrincola nitratireducens]
MESDDQPIPLHFPIEREPHTLALIRYLRELLPVTTELLIECREDMEQSVTNITCRLHDVQTAIVSDNAHEGIYSVEKPIEDTINAHVAQMITSLQFQDRLSQVLSNLIFSLVEAESVITSTENLPTEEVVIQFTEMLKKMRQRATTDLERRVFDPTLKQHPSSDEDDNLTFF